MRFLAGLLLAASVLACPSAAKPPVDAGASAVTRPPTPPAPAPILDVTDENYQMPPLPRGTVKVAGAKGEVSVAVEVAATTASRTRGLMWRWSLAEGQGMLFLFSEQQPLSFWMRNTLIPLDMVFIDERMKVVGVVENTQPRTLDSRSPGALSRYVLEVPAGYASKQGVRKGSQVRFEGFAHIIAE
jgi:uncharacterized protein